MEIRKYLHSCILLEKDGKKILLDPGNYSFSIDGNNIENRHLVEDIGSVDAILITHKHLDHCYPSVIKYFMKNGAKIYGSNEVASLLLKEGIDTEILNGEENIVGFSVRPVELKHEEIPTEIPHNFGFLIDGFLHAGDSLSIPEEVKCDIWAMPVAGPWTKLIDSLRVAEKLKPKYVVPIHDAIIKDFMRSKIYEMCDKYLSEKGITFKVINSENGLAI